MYGSKRGECHQSKVCACAAVLDAAYLMARGERAENPPILTWALN